MVLKKGKTGQRGRQKMPKTAAGLHRMGWQKPGPQSHTGTPTTAQQSRAVWQIEKWKCAILGA
ncbi:hypothetical protein [Acidovorax carolinensis]|uniref:hypothetical protein n=1 Tax=Acidovorax carolinensis TaxID=553814 RepID=UPI0012FF75A1|nr:hypothetical protein [Acidovorax carolinensis]